MIRWGLLLGMGSLAAHPLPIQDLGVDGQTFPIAEPDVLEVIASRLTHLEKTGDLALHNQRIQEQFRQSLHHPKGQFLPKTTESRVFYVDPTVTLPSSIEEAQGKILFPAGTRVNPFDSVSMTHPLFFVDGTDPDQVELALEERAQNPNLKIILIQGDPFALMERTGVPLFFDQSARLIRKLKLTHVPTKVTQDNHWLRLEECPCHHP
jgi:conjugal transfer pilus assembly protein TraW